MKQRRKYVKTVRALKLHLFSIHQSKMNRLPPTHNAFRQMLMRAHFTALQWKSLYLRSAELPNSNEYNRKWDETKEIFEPVITRNPPAPDSIIELISCGCKTDCQTDRC